MDGNQQLRGIPDVTDKDELVYPTSEGVYL